VPLLCYFDAFSGISGDMLVGALADAGASQSAIGAAIASMEIGARVSFEKVKRRGIGATKFHVEVQETKQHRHLPHILHMIEKADMPEAAKRNAARVFERLGEAEASVHRVPVEKVHFHEVGAADSIADIVGACLGLELLGVTSVACSAVNVGSGTVNTEHGVLPVPAPATAALLAGRPVYARGPELELTTPTGAAVAATLATSWGAMPALRLKAQGYGAGGYDFAEHANVLRILIGEPSGASEATTVTVIEANLDDASPQVLAFAAERLFERGALDVTLQPIVMKKGRPGTLLRVLAKPEDRETLAQTVFAETTTFGLRLYDAERRVQSREWVEVATRYGAIRVKASGDGAYAPEYEDCRKAALAAGAPLKDVIAAANHAYLNRSK
jgi:pyridinium-3,5-bisthiocarboxylic acid mononucleotide nickel chelatase